MFLLAYAAKLHLCLHQQFPFSGYYIAANSTHYRHQFIVTQLPGMHLLNAWRYAIFAGSIRVYVCWQADKAG